MKKHILIFTLFFIAGVSLVFADKSRFYENGKVLDTMYVDSSEGLRVRDKPSLKSNRLCGLPHRLPVKIVAIGKEDTIDGIKSNWVKVEIISGNDRDGNKLKVGMTGWCYGGYLE